MLNVLNQCLMRTSPHLLLVEDDFRLRHDLERHLVQRGFTVTTCVDGTQGLEALCAQSFDLVLLDILLPGMDGLSLLEALRLQQTVPVMLMSALGNEQDRISGFTRVPMITCPNLSAWRSSMHAPTRCCGACPCSRKRPCRLATVP